MSQSIEELRAQRKLIQQHLNWLDAQIQAQAADANERPSVESVPTDSQDQEIAETTAPVSDVNTLDPIEAGFAKSSSASDIQRTQIGCFVFFAAITLLFLFLLFGLPYLLD